MDGYELVGAIGLLILICVLALVLVPLLGLAMEYVITNWFGQEIDKTLYWTGVGLLSVLAFIVSTKNKEDD